MGSLRRQLQRRARADARLDGDGIALKNPPPRLDSTQRAAPRRAAAAGVCSGSRRARRLWLMQVGAVEPSTIRA